MSETAEGCNLDGRWKVGSGDGPPNQAGCQNYRWKRSPRPVRCVSVSEPGGGMPDEVCVSMSCCYFGGLSAHARGPPRASTSGGQRPVNSLSPRIGETRRGGGTAGGLARQGGWPSPYRRKTALYLCSASTGGRAGIAREDSRPSGMAWHGMASRTASRSGSRPCQGYRYMAVARPRRDRGVIERWPHVRSTYFVPA